ncbi:MAG: hypothetical protein LRZ88_04555 [Candidatus Cloacimonetes bacterium]|nr:hypothetical protein [Candidatus Cloacimonadota bacterium]
MEDIEYAYYDESLNELRAEAGILRTPSLDPMALLKRLLKGKKGAFSGYLSAKSGKP